MHLRSAAARSGALSCTLSRTQQNESVTMRFVSVRELRGRSASVWKALAEERELVVTSNGKPVALLSATSEESLEESLSAVRRTRAQASASAMQQASLKAGTDRMSIDDVNREIVAARAERSR